MLRPTCVSSDQDSWSVSLKTSLKVTLGDGYKVDAVGCGTVVLHSELPCGNSRLCKWHDVLHVPPLSYNLFSMSMASEHEKACVFGKKTVKSLIKVSLLLLLLKWGNFTISNVQLMVCIACMVYMQTPKLKSQKKRNGIEDLDI